MNESRRRPALLRSGDFRWSDVLFGGLVIWTTLAIGIMAKDNVRSTRRARSPEILQAGRQIKDWRELSAHGHSMGPTAASVTIVVFSDFECPFCKRFAATIDTVHTLYPAVRIVERNFPVVALHPAARRAAEAAECAAAVGKYASIRKTMFVRQGLVQDQEWGILGRAAGIPDTSSFVNCVLADHFADAVDMDLAAARRIRLSGTPSFLINDSLYAGAVPLGLLRSQLDKILAGQ